MEQNTGSVTTSNGNVRSVRLTGTVSGGTATWTVEIYSKYALSWSGSTLSWSGAASGSQSVSYSGTGAWITVKSFTTSISANSSQTLSVTWSQPAVSNTPATTVSTSVTVSRAAEAPAAPSGLTATWQSDTQIKLTWSNNATSAAPYSGVQVQRRADGGSWVTIANLGAVTGYTDTGTSAGHRYDYRVQATGPGGSSGWHRISYQSDVSTTPIAPTGVTATKNSAGGIDTSATYSGYSWGVTYDVAESTDGGSTWTTRATGLSSAQWTHTNPDTAKTHRYRWRAVVSEPGAPSPDPTRYGPWSAASATVQLLTPPNPPSSLSPNGVIFDGSTSRVFSWRHNAVDTTSQTAYELRYRVAGGSWTTVTGTTSSSRTISGGTFTNGKSYEWQVRTRGQHADFSNWSPVATFQTAARPTVAISAPDGDIATSLVTVSWAFFSAAGVAQRSWMAELIRAGQVVETLQDVGTASTATFASRLSDGETVQVRVTVTDTNGLTSLPDVTTATTTFPMPVPVSVEPTWDPETGAANLDIQTGPVVTYSWEGTPNASASIETTGGVETRRNLIQNPGGGGSGSLAGWALVPGSPGGTGFTQTYETLVPVVDPPGVHVSKMRRQTWTAVSATTGASNIGYRMYANARPPVIPGLVLGFEWWWRPSWEPVSDTSRLELRWYDAAGAQVGATVVVGLPVATAGVWQRIRHVSPVPAGAAQVTVGHSLSVPAGVIQIGDQIAAAGAIVITAATEAEALAQLDAGFFSGDTPDTVAAVTVDIARSTDGGTTWETVAEGVDPGTTVVDRTAPLGGTIQYRATSWSDLPSSMDGEVAELTPPLDRGFLSGGDDFGTVSVIEVNAGGPPVFDVTEGLLERVVSYYEGRTLGVEHSGVSRGRTGTVTWALTRDELATLQTLAHLPGPHLLRTPFGDNLYVSISRVSRSAVSGGQWWQVSLSVTEVEP